MINSLWISKTGMEAQQTQLDVISNNLANVSTTGFKRASAVFEDLMYQNLRQVGSNSSEQSQLPTGLQLGLGVRTVATSRSFAQGNLQQSGNKLDVAIQGNGFFQVTMPDGTTNYTRDGSFRATYCQRRHFSGQCNQYRHRFRRNGYCASARQYRATNYWHYCAGELC